uniref:Uncharacterized protein n=1 Tax=Timema tahoe TaxID=61484 RepID=A0A7R9P036_9NEOP|nr:unnamed protein product [Timema tahoe]
MNITRGRNMTPLPNTARVATLSRQTVARIMGPCLFVCDTTLKSSEKEPQREVVETIKLVEAADTYGGNSMTCSSPNWSKTWPQHLSAFLELFSYFLLQHRVVLFLETGKATLECGQYPSSCPYPFLAHPYVFVYT